MERVIPLVATAGVFSPLELPNKPIDGQPPMLLERNQLIAFRVAYFDGEVRYAMYVNPLADLARKGAWAKTASFGIEGSMVVNVL